jgi:hypothetical protein
MTVAISEIWNPATHFYSRLFTVNEIFISSHQVPVFITYTVYTVITEGI